MRKVLPLSVLLASAAIIAAAPIHDRDGILRRKAASSSSGTSAKPFSRHLPEENNLWLPHTNYEHKLKIERRATPAAMTITNPQSKESDTARNHHKAIRKPRLVNSPGHHHRGIRHGRYAHQSTHKELYFTAINGWRGQQDHRLVPFGFLQSRKPVQTYLEFPA